MEAIKDMLTLCLLNLNCKDYDQAEQLEYFLDALKLCQNFNQLRNFCIDHKDQIKEYTAPNPAKSWEY